ncbi:MAG: LysM peptidoglycan-binding domain-containing protein [Planctomycetota bacterium]
MRTEVKVGLLICVVAVVVVAAYLMIFSGDDDVAPETDPTATPEAAPEPTPEPRPSARPKPSLSRGGPLELPERPEPAATTRPAPEPEPLPSRASANRPVPVTAIELPPAEEVTETPAAGPTPSVTDRERLRLDPAPSREARTYVVREGDKGFWTIAAKPEVYGAGRYHYLISRANPGIDSHLLQPGQTLTIPPLPVEGQRTASSGDTRRNRTDGGMQYTVKEGDTCWILATRFLGDAARYPEIVRANPGIDADNLTVGQTITIPRRTAEATLPRPRAATTGGTSYTIAAGDTLSSIAKDHYGSKALWLAIAEANEGLDPDRLRVGATITLPSADEARRLAGVDDTAAGGSTARSDGGYVPGKPWFDQ